MTIFETVKELLIKYPFLRDNDKRLMWAVWHSQHLVNNGVITKDDFYNHAEYPESITRARRMVQEKHPELSASGQVEAFREEKEKEKGTFVFREEVNTDGAWTSEGRKAFFEAGKRIFGKKT